MCPVARCITDIDSIQLVDLVSANRALVLGAVNLMTDEYRLAV